jgi:hypothetical protein
MAGVWKGLSTVNANGVDRADVHRFGTHLVFILALRLFADVVVPMLMVCPEITGGYLGAYRTADTALIHIVSPCYVSLDTPHCPHAPATLLEALSKPHLASNYGVAGLLEILKYANVCCVFSSAQALYLAAI